MEHFHGTELSERPPFHGFQEFFSGANRVSHAHVGSGVQVSVQSGRRVKYRFALYAVRQDWKVVRVLLLEVVDDFYAESFGRANLTVVSSSV